ncbi:MAG TPA: pentapeptide repeat-containing protein [Pyrinomonadaceae bacterium]|nr:pentapeptide repeat-containing protein [Pyrinomonadaceae bacterium]
MISRLISKRRGKEAVEKGRDFELTVAKLYRMLGGEVIHGIQLANKKIDMLVTFRVPGSLTAHRVIVECKDEHSAVDANQRVMQFHGLLNVLRKSGEADSAEIITRVPWSDAARGFAYESGISLLTYEEKVAQLLDFSTYLVHLRDKFETQQNSQAGEPALGSYYVDLSGESFAKGIHKTFSVVNAYIDQWLRDTDTKAQLAIFGEYGAGKTSLCQKIAHDLAAARLGTGSSNRIPILFNLRDFIGKVEIEPMIASFLDRECEAPNPRYDLFKMMNDAGLFLILFDGFDEMAVKVDSDVLELNLMEIDKLAAAPNSKVILTSRPEYFVSSDEERRALNPSLNVFRTRGAEYEPVRILPWEESQIDRFLERRVPLVPSVKEDWTYYRDQIRRIPALADLSQRPVLLDMIVRTLPEMIEKSTSINLPNLYKTYLSQEIRRQKISKKRAFLLTEGVRLSLLKKLAVDVYCGSVPSITFIEALARLEQEIAPARSELEAFTREFLTNSFLIRTGEEYRFSHKSILEYLVTEACNEEINSNAPDAFRQCRINAVIVEFLIALEVAKQKGTLSKWIESTVKEPDTKYMGGNAATLLYAIDKRKFAQADLSGTTLTGANLSFADLREMTLNETSLEDVNLVGARFLEHNLAHVICLNTMVSFYLTQKIKPSISSIEKEIVAARDIRVMLSRCPVVRKRLIRASFNFPFKHETLVTLEMNVSGKGGISSIRQDLQNELSASVAVYADEYDELVKAKPHLLRPETQSVILPGLLPR